MRKSDIFNTELNYINDECVKESARYLLDRLPDYFYTMSASTSGNFHPAFSLGEGGLVRHTKAAVRIAIELFRDSVFNTFEFKKNHQDLIIMALLLHDGFKQGREAAGHTCFDHPLIAANFIFENINNLTMKKIDVLTVMRLIKSHMGPWNVDEKNGIVLPIPVMDDEKFVHACDYLSSRNFLNIEFDGNEIVDSVNRDKKRILKK